MVLPSALGNTINKQAVTKKLHEVGVIFFETNPLPSVEINKLLDFELIIAGSSWNHRALTDMGIVNVKTVIQGINTDLFKPSAKKVFRDRFVVFSGGKLEYRKGQDIALKAFSIFSEKHTDALLVAAWRSDWENKFSESINNSNLCSELKINNDFQSSMRAWIERNGIKPSQYLLIDSISNSMMNNVYSEVDVAIFPNRCEGGTNLVAMEAMSSGITCIISKNTGHLDIIKQGNCIALTTQGPLKRQATEGWGESSVEEIVSHLEAAYDRGPLDRLTVSSSMVNYSWKNSIGALLNTIKDISH
jgi:glycosyltransferase involved in cell wall biosynthesis